VISTNWQAALGVFLIFLGFNGFISLRLTKVEEMIKEMKKKNGR